VFKEHLIQLFKIANSHFQSFIEVFTQFNRNNFLEMATKVNYSLLAFMEAGQIRFNTPLPFIIIREIS
jgi:hypothetical protein